MQRKNINPEQPAARAAALQKLAEFVPRSGSDYSKKRNFDFGRAEHHAVSGLSHWLRKRIVSEREVVAAVLAQHSAVTAEKFIQEVFWRSYWKGWLEMRPQVWQQYQQDLLQYYNDESRFAVCAEILNQGAGIECFDYWLQELKETGYLHNHARMWFASIWIHTLKLPWQLGADFFLQHLLDGDPASNTLSWRWVAGLQTKGKAYAATAENIAKFTNGRFNPAGQLQENIEPLTEPHVFDKHELPEALSEFSPKSGVKVGLILHDDDLHPDMLAKFECVDAVLALHSCDLLSPGGVSELVTDYSRLCMESVSSVFDSSAIQHISCSEMSEVEAAKEQVVSWALAAKLDEVVWPYAPTGATATLLSDIRDSLLANDIKCSIVKSAWDTIVWPHAGKGFFALKKKIPDLLQEIYP